MADPIVVDTGQTNQQEIAAEQLSMLRAQIAALNSSNRFYSPILRSAGVTADIDSLEMFRRQMPLTTKQQLVDDQLRQPPHGTNLTQPIEQYSRYSQTSGSTAEPLRWLDTDASWSWMIDLWCRVFCAAAVGRGDRILFAFSFGPFIGFWLAFEAGTAMGCLCLPGGGLSSSARLKMTVDNGVTILCCTPTYALHLGQTAREQDIATSIRLIVVAGEPGGSVPAVRRRIAQLWHGARVFDHHGMTETGPVSHEDPDRAGVLRIMEPDFIAEVIDPQTQEPVDPGQTGELVLTNLGRVGSPLLRYRTGDIVRRTADPFIALDGGIIGRVDDMITVRGVNVFPSVIDDIVRADSAVAEYRVEVHRKGAMTQMSVVIEPTTSGTHGEALARKLESALRSTLSLRIPVRVVEPGALPRFEHKARRWHDS